MSQIFPRFIFLSITLTVVGIGCSRQSSDNARASTNTNKANSGTAGQSFDASQPGDSEEDFKIVQADVQRILTAFYTNDIDTVLAHTHSKILMALGGPAAAKSELQPILEKMQSSQTSLESLTFPQAPSFVKTAERSYAIVPTLSIVIVRKQRIESLNFQFGVKEIGATNWTYVEGSRVSSQLLAAYFPDFPSNYQFPAFYRKKL